MFGGHDDTSFLKAISHILVDKRVKSSHIVSVINDILNRYPYIELGAVLNMASVCENSKTLPVNYDFNLTHKGDTVISCTEVEPSKGNDTLSNNLDSTRRFEAGSSRVIPFTERLRCDSDVSTDVFEWDSRSVAVNDGQTSGNSDCDVNPASNVDEQLRKDNASDFDKEMKKVYENSLKLKEQLLKDSSNETSFIDSESSDSSTIKKSQSKKSVKKRGIKEKGRTQKKLSKEERDLRRLMNLRSLERKRAEDSDSSTSSEESSRNKQRTGRKCKETKEGDTNSDDVTLNSKGDDQSSGEVELPNPSSEIDFLKRCTTFLKESILETTSSESEDVKKSTEVKKKPDKSVVCRSKKIYRSKWQDELPDTTADDSSDEDDKKRKGSDKKRYCSRSREGSSDSFKPTKRRKRKPRAIISTESDSSCVDKEKLPSSESPGKGRRSIRKILKKGSLQLETRQAIKAENERKKRMVERNEIYKKFYPDMTTSDRLVLDFDCDTGEALLEVPNEIVKNLKPHQKEGIKFMWDNCFESLTSLEENSGSGCILAHCMGLGKTLQVITLIATLMKNNLGVDTVLILCPVNVANNWVREFEHWLEDVNVDFDVYNGVKYKNCSERYHQIRQWHKEGGVLILSYDMMRILTKSKAKSKAPCLTEHLIDPGPDLVICDEGHVIKNEETSISKAVSEIKTARRVILTGTPLQNNLLEYHSMVQFIKPNILGTRKEFMNRFANPIRNGQFEDSTAQDVKLMRARSHVLHKLLDGCIQRFSYSVLTPFLPEKHEYVISVRLTETQAKLYSYYVDKCKKVTVNEKGIKLFSDFHWLQKVWNHPKLVRVHMEERGARSKGDSEASSSDESVICIEADASEEAYWKTVIKPEDEVLSGSGKLLLLFDILKWCQRIGDKVLVFSQSLGNLDLIESFLREVHLANRSNSNREDVTPRSLDTWISGEDYFRMDGSTGSDLRSKWCKWFNNKKNVRGRLFLISTRAGGLGINLVGANRVVIFDASWNPSHDVQSIFRVYRFGQTKPCYIYRFIAEATMEEKIYERQVTKLSLEKRVLDEHQIERHYTMGNLQELYKYDPLPKEKWPVPIVPKDMILAEILKTRRDVIVTYHEHDTLLENVEEDELTEEERKAAWEDFEKEKFMIEHQLERKAIDMQKDGQSMDELTRDVLRITGMYRASGSQVPYFTPSLPTHSDHGLPFKIVNVQSLGRNFPTGFTPNHPNVRKFP